VVVFRALTEFPIPKAGREIDWLRNSLTQAHSSLNLANGYQASGSDVVQEVVDELYYNARLPLFHATTTRTVFVPHSLRDRETVSEAVRKLTQLLLFLVEKWLNAKRLSGRMTYHAFDTTIKAILASSEILVSDDDRPLDPAHGTRAEAGFGSAVTLATRHAPELSSRGRQFWLGEANSTDLRRLGKISRCAVAVGETVYSHHKLEAVLEAELTHGGIDRFEAQMGIYLVNARQPKYLFTA